MKLSFKRLQETKWLVILFPLIFLSGSLFAQSSNNTQTKENVPGLNGPTIQLSRGFKMKTATSTLKQDTSSSAVVVRSQIDGFLGKDSIRIKFEATIDSAIRSGRVQIIQTSSEKKKEKN